MSVEIDVVHKAYPDPEFADRHYDYCVVCRAAVHQQSGVWVHSGTLNTDAPTP